MDHMIENAGAAKISFTQTELADRTPPFPAIQVQGQRLPDSVLAFSEVEAPPRR